MDINSRLPDGIVILGCGKMGSAMLAGWLRKGIAPERVFVIDPAPSDWLRSTGVHLNTALPAKASLALIAVKPQMMSDALPQLLELTKGNTIFVSVAAGTSIDTYESSLGRSAPIIRAMPNTPAAIGQGITALIGNARTKKEDLSLVTDLLSVIGQTVHLEHESQMDAVTGVSGSGPAYVFHMIETLAEAAKKQGLSDELAMTLAKATVAGAGALALTATESPEQLRINVTSPNGTTQAGLEVLMDQKTGLAPLMEKTVLHAIERSRELSNG